MSRRTKVPGVSDRPFTPRALPRVASANDEKETSTQRLEALSDGVFAVAMTLLILDIKVPDVDPGRLWPSLLLLAPHLMAFALSFLIVTFYWTAHHVLFNAINESDRLLLWFNAAHLL